MFNLTKIIVQCQSTISNRYLCFSLPLLFFERLSDKIISEQNKELLDKSVKTYNFFSARFMRSANRYSAVK